MLHNSRNALLPKPSQMVKHFNFIRQSSLLSTTSLHLRPRNNHTQSVAINGDRHLHTAPHQQPPFVMRKTPSRLCAPPHGLPTPSTTTTHVSTTSFLRPTKHSFFSAALPPLITTSTHLFHAASGATPPPPQQQQHQPNKPSTIPNCVEYHPQHSAPQFQLSDKEWRDKLGTNAYFVLRHGDTDPRGIGYTHNKDSGLYECRGCHNPLFHSKDKFDSFCGWPSFDDAIAGAVMVRRDADGMRKEIICTKCFGHLGHVFEGEGFTKKNVRHCVNSSSVCFLPQSDQAQKSE